MLPPERIGNLFKLSFGEEIGNAVSHGAAAGLTLIALPICAVFGFVKGGYSLAAGDSVFLICLFLMFLTSCLYHSMSFDSPHKRVFRILDHSAIYLAISGTFTPICLSVVRGWLGIAILVLQWGMTIIGIIYKSLSRNVLPKASVTIYLIMGWMGVLLLPSIIRAKMWTFSALIFFGGLLYSIGVSFYSRKDKNWFHFIWHLFIFGAALSHLVAIIFFIPS